MKDCFRRIFLPSLSLLFFAGAFLGSCTDVDDTLGWGLLPDDQEMIFKQAVVDGVRTYSAMSDSLPVNQRGAMLLGNYTTAEFGHLRAGALSQFVPGGFSDPDVFFGYKPRIDSVCLTLSFAKIFGNTEKKQKFYIYKLTEGLPNTEYVPKQKTDGDSITNVWYYDFDNLEAEKYADMATPLFSFTLQNETTGSIRKTLEYEAGAEDFINDLINVPDSIYDDNKTDSLFHNIFHGLYIAPSPDPADAPLDGAMYLMTPLAEWNSNYYAYLDNVSLELYGLDFYEKPTEDEKTDPITMPDNSTMWKRSDLTVYYSFDDLNIAYPNTNIMVLDRDYSTAVFSESDFIDPYKFTSGTEPSQPDFFIQGAFGVAGYLDFGAEFLDQLHALCVVDGEQMLMKVNKAKLHLWLKDDTNENMKNAPSRLGMYYKYKHYYPTNIPDYDYYTEQVVRQQQSASYVLPYWGYINRSKGYYEMDLSTYIQELLTKPEETGTQVWLAPEVSNSVLLGPVQVALQNPPDDGSGNPHHQRVSLDLTYTLLKTTIEK